MRIGALRALWPALLAAPVPGQGDPSALAARADAASVAALTARAEELAAHKQHGKAAALWRELLQQWAPGHEPALAALGFVKVGEAWRRDANKIVLDRDLAGDAKALKKLDQQWTRAQKELAQGHERAARALAAAGRTAEAVRQWRAVLRFRPADRDAAAALQGAAFDGHPGSADELRLLRKGRAIAQAVQYLQQTKPRTVPIQGRSQPHLQRAGLPHHGVQSDHFEIWGTLPAERLTLAAEYAERTLLLCRLLFGTSTGVVFQPADIRPILWVGDRPTYQRVIDANAEQFGGDRERIRFLKEDVELVFLLDGKQSVRLYVLSSGGDDELLDQVVRGVAQDASGIRTHGLWEGIGHAACGFFFGRTLTFFVEQQHAHTVTSFQSRPLVPDLTVWAEVAAESAWARNDTPSARLVLLHASKFTNEERVKAWAIADYLLRKAPERLLELDACREREVAADKREEVRDPAMVAAEYERRTGQPLPALDAEWRDYWGSMQALRTAMAGKPAGTDAEIPFVQQLVYRIDDVRAAADLGPVGFYVSSSADVMAALDWCRAMLAAELAQKQNPKQPPPLPAPPAAVGRTVLVFRGSDPAAAVASWMLLPGARDLLLHPGRLLFGGRQDKLGLALDLAEPALPAASGPPITWPRHRQTGVPAGCRAADLGPGCAPALLAAGKGPDAAIGTPLSLHFCREVAPDELAQIGCIVTDAGAEVQGVLLCVQGDGPAIETAAGCVLFVPLQPLPSGRAVAVQWTLPASLRTGGRNPPAILFAVQ